MRTPKGVVPVQEPKPEQKETMQTVSTTKFTISWIISTFLVFAVSAVFHSIIGSEPTLLISGTLISTKLAAIIAFLVIAMLNLIIHGIFYFGGFSCSPFKKGLTAGLTVGFIYFLAMTLSSSLLSVHAPWGELSINFLIQMTEQIVGGITISVLIVSEFHRWGIFRWV